MENYIQTTYLPEGYLINDKGIIINSKGKQLKQNISNSGYYCINIKNKGYFTHRALAFGFIKQEPNKEYINHKDGIKTNNELSNLEWCTKSYNIQHAYDTGLKTYKPLHYKGKKGKEHNRSITLICEGVTYYGYSEASRKLNIPIYKVHYRVNSKNKKWREYQIKNT